MGNLKGFEKGFPNSKIASRKIISDSTLRLGIDNPGNYNRTIGLKSNTKAAVNPTSDLDENPRAGSAPQANGDVPMVPSSKGGASGDGPTPGYSGTGSGVASLNGAQGNRSFRI